MIAPTTTDPTTPAKANVINETPTTPEEMEKYEAYLDKNFVRVKDGKVIHVTNPTGSKFVTSEETFFYKVDSVFMRYYGMGNEAQGVMRFNIQKFIRSKPIKELNEETGRMVIKGYEQARSHEQNKVRHNWVLTDSDASFAIDCVEFDKHFKPE